MKIIQVTLEDNVHTALKNAARDQRISMAEVIRQVLAGWAARKTKVKKGGAS